MSERKHIIVGMSGGVDSSVTALLLKEQGNHVTGVFMRNWEADQNDPYCSIDQDQQDAHAVAQLLNIPFQVVNFAENYWQKVFQIFLDEYAAGRTPNPDILCNKEIKFKAFLDYALSQGADAIATGHYAQIRSENGQNKLLKGYDTNKDQSYFLYTLKQKQLAKALFPLGHMTKQEVREKAQKAGFVNHAKKDSTGICFIGERKFKSFLNEYLLAKPGKMMTSDGKEIGRHDGLMFYTLGQRQGLKIGGQKNAQEAPWYVVAKNIAENILIVDQDHNHPLLLNRRVILKNIDWVDETLPNTPFICKAKTRYRQIEQTCQIKVINHETCEVLFDEPQWAVTPGQSLVFYDNEVCLGGGIITDTQAQ